MLLTVNTIKKTESEVRSLVYVTMLPEVYNEMFAYVDAFDTECSGYGLVERFEHGTVAKEEIVQYHVDKIFLPNQVNTSHDSEVSEIGSAQLVKELIDQGEDVSRLKCHWHSHVNMGVFHSGTDKENYDGLQTGDYLVTLVANKKKEIYAGIEMYKPLRLSIKDITVYVNCIGEDISQKVKENVERVKRFEEVGKEKKKLSWTSRGYDGKWSDENKKNKAEPVGFGKRLSRAEKKRMRKYPAYSHVDDAFLRRGAEYWDKVKDLIIQERVGKVTIVRNNAGYVIAYKEKISPHVTTYL